MRGGVVVLILAVGIALLLGGFLHAVIPHEHENETIWNALHAALRHEEEYVLLAFLAALWCGVFIAAAPRVALSVYRLPQVVPPLTRIEKALHRGIVAYRKFG